MQSDLLFSVLNEKEQLLRPALVAQLNAHLTGDQEVADSTPLGRHYFYMEIDHKIFSTVILSIPLIREGQLSVSVKRMCTILVNTCSLED